MMIYGPMPKPLPTLKAKPLEIGVRPDPVMPLGRHKGQRLSTIPRQYLKNLYKNHFSKLGRHEWLVRVRRPTSQALSRREYR